MSKLATLVVAVGALAFVTLSPNSAEAGWRRGWGWGPGVNVYVGPRYGWYGYRSYYRPLCLLLRLSLRLLSLLARTLLARLVLGTRAAEALVDLRRAIPELGSGPSAFLARAFTLNRQMNDGLSFSSERSS